jgi:hypothetical protein
MHQRAPARRRRLVALAVSAAFTVAALSVVANAGAARANPARSAPALDVLPFPGTPDASPRTEIDFPAIAPSELATIAVRGSSSGLHTGHLGVMRPGRGVAFVPEQPFTPGERVSVDASIRSRAGGAASGVPNPDRIRFGFTVARPAALSGAGAGSFSTYARVSSHTPPFPVLSFRSEPGLHPPKAFISGRANPTEGDFFLDAHNSIQGGPLILSPSGQIYWYAPVRSSAAFNVQVQQYMGRPVITFWRGYVVPPGVGIGTDMVIDHSYQTVASVNAANGYHTDLHEFQITPQGTALITVYAPVHANLSSVGGSRRGTLLDSIIQEIDISSGKLLWEWHAYGHVPVSDSYAGTSGSKPYDYFHLNSIQELPNGDLLISARHTSAVYEISRQTGRLVWALGGKHSSFRLGSGAAFASEHDAELQADGTLTVFDDSSGPGGASGSQSRALRIRLNTTTRRAKLVSAFTNRPPLQASSQGNVQLLPDGNTVVGWGNAHYFTEFDRRGREQFIGHFGGPIQTYRAFRFPWTGQPTGYPPALAVSPAHGGSVVYASWNGATDVGFWQVLAGPDRSSMVVVAQRGWGGFETAINTNSKGPCFAVQAMASSGRVLSTSNVAGC